MTGSIDTQTWTIIQDTDRSQHRDVKHQKLGSARIAEENSSTKDLADLQQIAKDIVLPAQQQGGRALLTADQTQTATKPTLLIPGVNWNFLRGVGPIEPGLISIIGAALILQAKTNSNFWSTMWKQASESMQIEVKFAPIIGKAIYNSYYQQSQATQSQSDQAKEEGKISMGMFAGSVFLSIAAEFGDDENVLNSKSKNVVKQDENAPTNEQKTGRQSDDDGDTDTGKTDGATRPQNATEKLNSDTSKEIEKQDESYYTRAKKYWEEKISPKIEKGQKRFTSLLGRGVQTSTAMQMASEGFTKYFVTSKYQAEQAVFQANEGRSQALSKESEQYAQFFGQDFSRSEDIRQGAGQNIDFSLNLIKTSSDTVTQTVTSMFRG